MVLAVVVAGRPRHAQRSTDLVQIGAAQRPGGCRRPAAVEGARDVGLDVLVGVASLARVKGDLLLEVRLRSKQIAHAVGGLLDLVVEVGVRKVRTAEDGSGEGVELGLDGRCGTLGVDDAQKYLTRPAARTGNGTDGFRTASDVRSELAGEGDEVMVLAAAGSRLECADAGGHVAGAGDAKAHDLLDDLQRFLRCGGQPHELLPQLLLGRRRGRRRGEGGGGRSHSTRTERERRGSRSAGGREGVRVTHDNDTGTGLAQAEHEFLDDTVGLVFESELFSARLLVQEFADESLHLGEIVVDSLVGGAQSPGGAGPDVLGHEMSFRGRSVV